MAKKMIPLDGECCCRIKKREGGKICLLIHVLGIEIHRIVEKVVDKHVDKSRKYSIVTILYLIAYDLSN